MSCGQDTSRCFSCSCNKYVMAADVKIILGITLRCCFSEAHQAWRYFTKQIRKRTGGLFFLGSFSLLLPAAKTFDFVCPQRTLPRKLEKLCHEIKAGRRRACCDFLVVYTAPVQGPQTSSCRCCPLCKLVVVRTGASLCEYLHRAPPTGSFMPAVPCCSGFKTVPTPSLGNSKLWTP